MIKSITRKFSSKHFKKYKVDDIIKLKIGDYGTYKRKFTYSDVYNYSLITGDDNPLHINYEYHHKLFHDKKIVHGMFVASTISTIFGTFIPNSIYMNQNLKFLAPVYINDTVLTTCTITNILRKKYVECSTVCQNNRSKRTKKKNVINGNATVLIENLELRN